MWEAWAMNSDEGTKRSRIDQSRHTRARTLGRSVRAAASLGKLCEMKPHPDNDHEIMIHTSKSIHSLSRQPPQEDDPAVNHTCYCLGTGVQFTMEGARVPLTDVEKSFAPTKVCVTGSTGYIAGSIVERLLASGHTVHATCRNPNKEESVAHLKKLPGAEERLVLFRADLLDEGSFSEAMAGCSCVMHTASPFIASIPKGKERELVIDPALKGTENVVAAVNATDSVKRLIVTSSCAAIYGDPTERGPDHVFTEDDWAIKPSESELAYFYSKKVAEERAFELCKQQDRWDIVTVNPAGVYGPPIGSRADGESVGMMRTMMNGEMTMAPKIGLGFVDVRDVAAAHCLGMADKSATGRYILSAESLYYLDIANLLKPKYPKAKLPKYNAPKLMMWLVGPWFGLQRDYIKYMYSKIPYFDNSKAKGLGIKFVDPKDTLEDMVQAMVDLGMLDPKKFT